MDLSKPKSTNQEVVGSSGRLKLAVAARAYLPDVVTCPDLYACGLTKATGGEVLCSAAEAEEAAEGSLSSAPPPRPRAPPIEATGARQ